MLLCTKNAAITAGLKLSSHFSRPSVAIAMNKYQVRERQPQLTWCLKMEGHLSSDTATPVRSPAHHGSIAKDCSKHAVGSLDLLHIP